MKMIKFRHRNGDVIYNLHDRNSEIIVSWWVADENKWGYNRDYNRIRVCKHFTDGVWILIEGEPFQLEYHHRLVDSPWISSI